MQHPSGKKTGIRQTRSLQRGVVSLAETLVGLTMVSGALLVVLGLFPSAYGSLIQAKSTTQATNLARLLIERQKSTAYPLIQSLTDNLSIPCNVAGRTVSQSYTYRVDVIPDPGNLDRYKDIVVTVSWNSGGASAAGLSHSILLQTEVPNW